MTQLTLEDARRISDAALTAADQHGWLISVAIIDRHGNLVHFARQDGSTLASVVSSQSKAWTAAAVGVSTQDLCSHDDKEAPGERSCELLAGGLFRWRFPRDSAGPRNPSRRLRSRRPCR